MKIDAIVYTSNTGHTKQYANLLKEKTGLMVYELAESNKSLPKNSHILYLGWLMAGKIQGYSKASQYYQIEATCGVGMGATGSQIEDVRKANKLSIELPLFILQGGFDITKLHGIYKVMMTVMMKTAGKGLADKKDRTADEDEMLEMLMHGGNHVSEANLKDVLEWYHNVNK